jgi:tetratricopeptide (TPR) repeat protein
VAGSAVSVPTGRSRASRASADDEHRATLPEPALAAGGFLLLAIVALAVYWRVLAAPFVFDDQASIVRNPSIVRLWPLIGEAGTPGPLAPSSNRPTAGRPLVNVSFAINYFLGGLDPTGYRLANLVVHLLSAALLVGIVRRTLQLPRVASGRNDVVWMVSLAAGALWALHPLTSEPVVYVTQRTELLMAFCYLLTLYASLRYWAAASAGARHAWLSVAMIACAAGMASKEVMVSAPLVVLLYERIFLRDSVREAFARSWRLYAALALCWVVLLLLNSHLPRSGSAGFHLDVPPHVWWLTQAKVVFLYLQLAFWPWPQSIHYTPVYLRTIADAAPWLVLASLLAAGTFVLVWRRHAAGFVAASIWLILAPTLLVPIVTEVTAERRMYLPLAGLVALVTVGAHRMLSSRFFAMVAVSVTLVASILTVHRLGAYQSAVTLWEDTVRHQPDDAVAHTNLGAALADAGRPDDAIPHFEQALRLEPDDTAAHNNLGALLSRIGRPADAIAHLQQALTLRPGEPKAKAHMNLGNALLGIGRTDEALTNLEQAVRLEPDGVDEQYNLGAALFTIGRPQDAIVHFEQALRLAPDDADVCNSLASALLRIGNADQAAAYYRRALALRPDFADAHSNLGAALVSLGRPDQAVEQFRIAVRLQPDNASAHYNLGQLLLDTGHPAEAAQMFDAAIRLEPDNVAARFKAAMAYAAVGRSSEAVAMAQDALARAHRLDDAALANEIRAWLIGVDTGSR